VQSGGLRFFAVIEFCHSFIEPREDTVPDDLRRGHKNRAAAEFADARFGAGRCPREREVFMRAKAREKFLREQCDVFGIAALFGIQPERMSIGILSDLPLKAE
jgi:hypothetical protein